MQVSGTWQNSYGSVMSLTQYDDGSLFGTYGSSTGSSGTYYVAGWTDTNPVSGSGQALGLALFWRSIDGGAGDPSWHWVSAFGGQAIVQDGGPTLNLVHDLVATDDFPAVANVGSYLDKLVYVPKPDAAATTPALRRPQPDATPDPINGTWTCAATGTTLALLLENAQYGYVVGTLTVGAASAQVVGFVDSYATSAGIDREGVALAAFVSGQAVTFSGYLELTSGALSLLQLQNSGTTPGNAYVQSNATGLTFVRQ